MRALGRSFGRVLEVDSRNLNRVDCSILNLLLELKVTDRVPQMVKLNLNGTSFNVAIAESSESPPQVSLPVQVSGLPLQSKHWPLCSVQISRNDGIRLHHAGSTKAKAVGERRKANGRLRQINEKTLRKERAIGVINEGTEEAQHTQPLLAEATEKLAHATRANEISDELLKVWTSGKPMDSATKPSSNEFVCPDEPKTIVFPNTLADSLLAKDAGSIGCGNATLKLDN